MKRSQPLRRGKPLQRRKPVPKQRQKPPGVPKERTRKAAQAYTALRRLVCERADHRCERCGTSLLSGFECHHRRLRSQGGRDDAQTCVALCGACHRWAHAHPADATLTGWIVRSRIEPAVVPVQLHDGRTVLLLEDGGYNVLIWPTT